MRDARFGELALCDVLDEHDRTAVAHQLERQAEGAPILLLDDHPLAFGAGLEPHFDVGADGFGLGAQDRAGGDAIEQQFLDGLAFVFAAVDDAEYFVEALVRHHDAPVGIEHRQSVRHVVERGVETARQERDLAVGDHRVEQRLPQPVGNRLHADEERQQHEGEDGVIGVAHHQKRQRDRQACRRDLDGNEAVAAEITAGDADQVGDRDRHGEDVDERIADLHERQEAPHPEQRDRNGGADDVAQLPVTHGLDRGHGVAPPGVVAHVPHAQRAGQHDAGEDGIEQRLADPPGADERRRRDREQSHQQRPRLRIDGVDQRRIDVERDVVVRPRARQAGTEHHAALDHLPDSPKHR